MKKIQLTKTTFISTAFLLTFVAGTSMASAATYSYINTQGNIQTVEAVDAQAALKTAVNIATHSGVVAGDLSSKSMATTQTTTKPAPEMMESKPTPNTPAADLRVGLNALMKEHVNLGLSALYNVIEENDATAGSVTALDANSIELAATVGSVYGKDAEDAFLKIWRDHIGFFANYAVGLRTDDVDMMNGAEADLATYQKDVAIFFNSALPKIEKATVVAGAGEHKKLLLEAMDEYAAGNYEAAYMAQREADKQISGIANLLATEIVAQNQASF